MSLNAFRWVLGLPTALLLVLWLVFLAWADGFRRSFGASENLPFLPFLSMVAVGVMLASLVYPEQRALLHATGALALVLLGLSVWLMTDTVFMGTLGVLYSLTWLAFYWKMAWAGGLGAGTAGT